MVKNTFGIIGRFPQFEEDIMFEVVSGSRVKHKLMQAFNDQLIPIDTMKCILLSFSFPFFFPKLIQYALSIPLFLFVF